MVENDPWPTELKVDKDRGLLTIGFDDGADFALPAELLRPAVAKIVQLRKMVSRIHIEKRHWDLRGPKRLLRQPQQADRILATGEKQRRALKLRRHLTHDVDRFGFEILKMV